jgi:hypothetical protein
MDPYGLDIVMVSGGGSSAKPISELQVTDGKPGPYGRALTHAPDHARRISLSAFTARAFNDRLRRLIDAALGASRQDIVGCSGMAERTP